MHLCRYWGSGGSNQTKRSRARAGTLARERLLVHPRIVRSIARELDRARPGPDAHGCPSSDGASLYVALSYYRHPAVIVEAELGGCGLIRSDFGLGGFPPPRVFHRLERPTKLSGSS
jgi:hypothetical protein